MILLSVFRIITHLRQLHGHMNIPTYCVIIGIHSRRESSANPRSVRMFKDESAIQVVHSATFQVRAPERAACARTFTGRACACLLIYILRAAVCLICFASLLPRRRTTIFNHETASPNRGTIVRHHRTGCLVFIC